MFSPGAIGSASDLHEVDFAAAVIEAIEEKVRLTRRVRLPPRQRHPGDTLTAHLGEQGPFETRKVAAADGGGSAAWPLTRGGDMSRSMWRMRRARLAALTGAVALLMALLPATAASAAPSQNACDTRNNNQYSKLLECVRLSEVLEHEEAFQAIADDNGRHSCRRYLRVRRQRRLRGGHPGGGGMGRDTP